jgi:hypothetical protein
MPQPGPGVIPKQIGVAHVGRSWAAFLRAGEREIIDSAGAAGAGAAATPSPLADNHPAAVDRIPHENLV